VGGFSVGARENGAFMDGRPAREPSPRVIEYYGTVIELTAAIVLRAAGGWHVISAGFVTADTLWAEYEQGDPL
jgi:hypothetical protein